MSRNSERYLKVFIDHFTIPLFAVDTQGRAVPLNRTAIERIGPEGDDPLAELLGHNGRCANEQVRCFLREVSKGNPEGIAVRRFHASVEGRAVDLVVLSPKENDSHALLMAVDVESCAPLDADVLMRWFGLTLREAEMVARIATGYSLKEAANELGISIGTARNHLKAAFQKTGISGQTRLAALIGVLGPFLRCKGIRTTSSVLSHSGHAQKAKDH